MSVEQVRELPHVDGPALALPAPAEPRVVRAVPAVRVRSGSDDPGRSRWATVGVAALLVLGVAVALWLGKDWPLLGGLGGGLAVMAALDFVIVRPVQLFLRRMASEAARLRAALSCPYCKDGLEDDSALACDRPGCGALYHDACWDECRGSYGGCAIYGCGSKTAHGMGWFALQRRVLRTLLAAVLFTPRLVQRLQASERATLREEWRRAREVQGAISASEGRTAMFALGNAAVCVTVTLGVVLLSNVGLLPIPALLIAVPLILVLPVLLIRAPLLALFAWGALRVVARLFRDELALLQRADAGTFLARLAGGAGKKA